MLIVMLGALTLENKWMLGIAAFAFLLGVSLLLWKKDLEPFTLCGAITMLCLLFVLMDMVLRMD